MGCSPFKRSCWLYENVTTPVDAPNPNPHHFELVDYEYINRNLVVRIQYPNCTNYEGMKILVYRDMGYAELSRRTEIDPHFSEDGVSPFARFEPTNEGWKKAVALAMIL